MVISGSVVMLVLLLAAALAVSLSLLLVGDSDGIRLNCIDSIDVFLARGVSLAWQ